MTLPVVELFGPTLQGEGPQQGRPAYFVRFGGCDFRCSWCDSMYAVDPAQVRAEARRLTAEEIIDELSRLRSGPNLVVLSGGNPALLELGPLVDGLKQARLEVAVETQGSRWKQWLSRVDCLVISPKGPSSGMDTPEHRLELEQFLSQVRATGAPAALKVVIFDEADLEFARWITGTHDDLPLYLSVGTDLDVPDEQSVDRMLERLTWLSEAVASDASLRRAHVGVQQHVLTWGTRKGV